MTLWGDPDRVHVQNYMRMTVIRIWLNHRISPKKVHTCTQEPSQA